MPAALLVGLLLLAGPAPVGAGEGEEAAALQGVDAAELIRGAVAVPGGERIHLEGRLHVKPRRRAPRGVVFQLWDDRVKNRTLLRLVAPRAISGTGLLRLPPNVWHHDPREETTARVPPASLLDPWLGSDFVLADLLQASLPEDDYQHRLLRVETGEDGGESRFVVESLPTREEPGRWGRVVSWIAVADGTPLRREFQALDGTGLRSLRYEDLRRMGDRRVPHRWVATSGAVEGGESQIDLVTVELDASFAPETFTTHHLIHP